MMRMSSGSPPTSTTRAGDTVAPVVSVIVPAHNAARRLPDLFAALSQQTVPRESFEVIVVDDASTDDTSAAVEANGVARLLRAPVNRGSYAARNQAIGEARAVVLAFTDTDCMPEPSWIENGLAALENADIAAGHVEIPLGEHPTAATLLGAARRHIDQEHRVSEYGFGATANLWLRRELIDRVGVFRDDLISGGDAEFCHRATAAGARLVYAPEARVTHPPRSRPAELLRKQVRLGYGAAQRAASGTAAARHAPRVWTQPRQYVPRIKIYGADVLERRGYRLTRRQHVSVRVLQYTCCQLPLALGNLAGTIAAHRESPAASLRRSLGRSPRAR